MRATYRVKNRFGDTVGFIVDDRFLNNTKTKEKINDISNITMLKNGVLRANKVLPAVQYAEAVTKNRYKSIVKQNPFERDIAVELKNWKSSNYKCILQVNGARQTGKTTEILKFAYSNYANVVYVNLVSDVYKFIDCIKQDMVQTELSQYCARANLPKFDNSRNTVIVIDEIQENVDVFNALRTLRNEVSCDIIITGSYLGTLTANFTKENNKKVFFSMGTIMPITMHTMSFREFCRAFNKEDVLMSIDIYGSSEKKAYEQLQAMYNVYCNIGGYPAVVSKYKMTKSITECHALIGSLLETFKQESARYFTDSKQIAAFELVYEQAIIEMLTEKRGSGKKLVEEIAEYAHKNDKGYMTREEVSNAITWLNKCNMISTCAMVEGNKFKEQQPNRRMYFMDCGIASYLADNFALSDAAKRGLLTETFAFCELKRLFLANLSNKKVKDNLCFSLYNQYELDFVLIGKGGSIENVVFGIEVKSNKGDPKSLKVYVSNNLVDKGILAENTQGGHGADFDTIPIYAVGARFPYK